MAGFGAPLEKNWSDAYLKVVWDGTNQDYTSACMQALFWVNSIHMLNIYVIPVNDISAVSITHVSAVNMCCLCVSKLELLLF